MCPWPAAGRRPRNAARWDLRPEITGNSVPLPGRRPGAFTDLCREMPGVQGFRLPVSVAVRQRSPYRSGERVRTARWAVAWPTEEPPTEAPWPGARGPQQGRAFLRPWPEPRVGGPRVRAKGPAACFGVRRTGLQRTGRTPPLGLSGQAMKSKSSAVSSDASKSPITIEKASDGPLITASSPLCLMSRSENFRPPLMTMVSSPS